MDDLISRKAAIERIEKQKYREPSIGVWKQNDRVALVCYDTVIEALKRLPSAQPKHGKWIRGTEKSLWDETDDGPVYTDATTWTCSECGYKRFITSCPDDKFCKECGARMEADHE